MLTFSAQARKSTDPPEYMCNDCYQVVYGVGDAIRHTRTHGGESSLPAIVGWGAPEWIQSPSAVAHYEQLRRQRWYPWWERVWYRLRRNKRTP